ncbi:MAG: hypothetical protein E7D33_07195 [Klebsiella sp.]|nr:hypothetical protein [Klebsiella sp.]
MTFLWKRPRKINIKVAAGIYFLVSKVNNHRQPGKDLREADKQRQHKEFIAAMNEFIAKGGTLTDDEFFRVL